MGENFWENKPDVPQRMSPEDTAKKDKEKAIQDWTVIKEGHMQTGNKAGILRANEALRKLERFDNNP